MPEFERSFGEPEGQKIPLVISEVLYDADGNEHLISVNQGLYSGLQIINAGEGSSERGLEILFSKLEEEVRGIYEHTVAE